MEFTQDQLDLMAKNGVSPEDISSVLELFPQSLETAIGYVVGFRSGKGQERNEPFQTQAEADAQVSAGAAPVVEALAEASAEVSPTPSEPTAV